MKIELLEKREDFKTIFINTLEWFIKVSPEVNSDEVRTVYLRYNPILNIVYPKDFSPIDLLSLVQDYRLNKNIFRRWMQQIYVWLAIKTPLEKFFSPYFPYSCQLPKSMLRCVFLPGSHSIRIIDFDRDCCFVVAKPDVFPGFIESDVNGRKGISIAPEVLHYDSKLCFFKEKRISGISVDRILAFKESMLAYTKVKQIMRNRYKESEEKVLFETYLLKLQSELNQVLEKLSIRLDSESSEQIQRIRETIKKHTLINKSKFILVCDTHGDLQPGNILVANKDIWLIDWEYSARRSYFFDAIVLECDSRNCNDLSLRLEFFYMKIKEKGVNLSWTGKDLTSENDIYFFLFLLEELIILLLEVSANYLKDPVKVIKPRLIEIERCLKNITVKKNI